MGTPPVAYTLQSLIHILLAGLSSAAIIHLEMPCHAGEPRVGKLMSASLILPRQLPARATEGAGVTATVIVDDTKAGHFINLRIADG